MKHFLVGEQANLTPLFQLPVLCLFVYVLDREGTISHAVGVYKSAVNIGCLGGTAYTHIHTCAKPKLIF